jgi:hypothetical protein
MLISNNWHPASHLLSPASLDITNPPTMKREEDIGNINKAKGKAIPVAGHEGP